MENKTFIGTWISKKNRIRLKITCAKLGITQQDVIELLIIKWLNKKDEEQSKIKQIEDGKQ